MILLYFLGILAAVLFFSMTIISVAVIIEDHRYRRYLELKSASHLTSREERQLHRLDRYFSADDRQ